MKVDSASQEWIGGGLVLGSQQNVEGVNSSPLPSQGSPSPNSDGTDFVKGMMYNMHPQSNGKSNQVRMKTNI